MKTLLRCCASTAWVLIMGATCFAQHYTPGNVSPSNSDAAAAPAAQMYFTAGPNHGSGGLFGYVTAASTELTEGNAQ